MERLYGVPLTDYDVIKQATGGRDPQQILINALNVWFGSILRAPSFHADVHQGAGRDFSRRNVRAENARLSPTCAYQAT